MRSGAELGFRSELIFHRANGEVTICAPSMAVAGPDAGQPNALGNYLLFEPRRRARGNAQRWKHSSSS